MAVGIDLNKSGVAGNAELVHEARKTIKRMRTLARLLREQLRNQEFKRTNNSLREAALHLAQARDAEVRLTTLEQLRARHPKALEHRGIERLSECLRVQRERVSESASTGEVLDDIATMRHDLNRLARIDPDFRALAPGLKRIYREGRRRYVGLKRESKQSAEQMHDWRKRVKNLYYALDMLGGANSVKQVRSARKRANRLGDLLGEEHDLWMLCTYIDENPELLDGDLHAHKRLLKLAEKRRKYLRKQALELGGRLYGPKPRAFMRYVGSALARRST